MKAFHTYSDMHTITGRAHMAHDPSRLTNPFTVLNGAHKSHDISHRQCKTESECLGITKN